MTLAHWLWMTVVVAAAYYFGCRDGSLSMARAVKRNARVLWGKVR